MKKVILEIEGMHCEGCSSRLEKSLKVQDGITSAKVDLESRKATICYDGIDIEKIEEYIADTGFKSLGVVEE